MPGIAGGLLRGPPVLAHGGPQPPGIASPPPPAFPDWPVAADEALWLAPQNELAALQHGSVHVIAAQGDHDIPLDQPDLVTSTLVDLVVQVRQQD